MMNSSRLTQMNIVLSPLCGGVSVDVIDGLKRSLVPGRSKIRLRARAPSLARLSTSTKLKLTTVRPLRRNKQTQKQVIYEQA